MRGPNGANLPPNGINVSDPRLKIHYLIFANTKKGTVKGSTNSLIRKFTSVHCPMSQRKPLIGYENSTLDRPVHVAILLLGKRDNSTSLLRVKGL